MGKRREVRVKVVGKPTRGKFRGELMPNEWLSSFTRFRHSDKSPVTGGSLHITLFLITNCALRA